MTVLVSKSKDLICHLEKCHIRHKVLHPTVTRVSALFMTGIAATMLTGPRTAIFLTEWFDDPHLTLLNVNRGKCGSNYSLNGIEKMVQRFTERSLQTRRLQAYIHPCLSGHLEERRILHTMLQLVFGSDMAK